MRCPTYLPCVEKPMQKGCNQLMALTESNNTLQAMTSIARERWKNVSEIHELFQKAYPINKKHNYVVLLQPPTYCLQQRLFQYLSLLIAMGP